MHPEICKIGPFVIYSYGLALVLAFMVGSVLARIQAKRDNLDPDFVFNFSFLVFVSGILGARIFYVMYNLDYYLKNPIEIIMLQHGGLAWFGGLILGSLSGILYLRRHKLSIYKTLDLFAPFLALGQAIGRVGCLLNGCCFGKESDSFGIYFPVHDATLIPTQLYSSLILVLIFIMLRFLQDRPHKEGWIFFVYLLLYSLKRFFIEFWRADSDTILLGLTMFQFISIAVFCLSIVGLLKTGMKDNSANKN